MNKVIIFVFILCSFNVSSDEFMPALEKCYQSQLSSGDKRGMVVESVDVYKYKDHTIYYLYKGARVFSKETKENLYYSIYICVSLRNDSDNIIYSTIAGEHNFGTKNTIEKIIHQMSSNESLQYVRHYRLNENKFNFFKQVDDLNSEFEKNNPDFLEWRKDQKARAKRQ